MKIQLLLGVELNALVQPSRLAIEPPTNKAFVNPWSERDLRYSGKNTM